jgi:DNA-binding NtrC family response regulator
MAITVIVIEDDPAVRQFLCTTLQGDGYAPVGVGTYEEAIKKLAATSADLVISDGFTAHGVSGISTLHRRFPHLPVIVISGSIVNKRQVPLPPHLVHVLPKPFAANTILETVRHALIKNPDDHLQAIVECGRLEFLSAFVTRHN